MNHRIKKISSILSARGLDALLVTSEYSVGYLSDFAAGEALLLLVPGKENLIITDHRFIQEASSLKEFKAEITSENLPLFLPRKFKELNLRRVGFEAKDLTYRQYSSLKEGCGNDTELVPTDELIEGMRAIKDETEIKSIKKAIAISICAFESLLKELKPGLTEKMLADRLESLIRNRGGRHSAFDIIVAMGRNSSRPHARAGQKRWKPQDLLLIDWGASFQEYNCDLTRVILSDKISPAKKKIYKILSEAQEKALSAIRPGEKAKDIDALVRNFLKKQRLDKFFLHSLGHGVGRQVHESPWLSAKSEAVLRENMVFTLEPAVYLPENAGMRLEDMVLVTKNGCEILSRRLKREYSYD